MRCLMLAVLLACSLLTLEPVQQRPVSCTTMCMPDGKYCWTTCY